MSWVKEELCTLLDLLSSDLNYDNIRKAKDKLKDLIENKEAQTMWFGPICTGDNWKTADHRKILNDLKHSRGCLLAENDRGRPYSSVVVASSISGSPTKCSQSPLEYS